MSWLESRRGVCAAGRCLGRRRAFIALRVVSANFKLLEVGVHEGASANILPLSLVVDTGYSVTLDQFVVKGDQYNMVFSRKVEVNGEFSKHYSCAGLQFTHGGSRSWSAGIWPV